MYVLRRRFGISAYDAEYTLPAYERELLLRGYEREMEGTEDEPDYSQPPDETP